MPSFDRLGHVMSRLEWSRLQDDTDHHRLVQQTEVPGLLVETTWVGLDTLRDTAVSCGSSGWASTDVFARPLVGQALKRHAELVRLVRVEPASNRSEPRGWI
ncbi:MAG: hypothetical protein ACJ73S_03710 [Mycobacteriales bacterium]